MFSVGESFTKSNSIYITLLLKSVQEKLCSFLLRIVYYIVGIAFFNDNSAVQMCIRDRL